MDESGAIALGESGGSVAAIPLRFLTRHGLIAGSTGTGKSRAMQVMAEQLAAQGIHVFVSDVKGDASGFCVPAFEQDGEPSEAEKRWNERNRLAPFEPASFAANYWSASGRFIPFRFSASAVGSVLFSRMLSLNPTQESHLALAFSYAKREGIPLDTPAQLMDVLDRMMERGERGMSGSSVSVIERKILAMQEGGLGRMFGSPSLRLEDLGGLNVLNLSDARSDLAVSMAPAFLLQKLFTMLPEAGELQKPKFVIFFDEAHYLFKDSNKSLRDLMVTMLKQIRSKGVAVFFVTQDAGDIPDTVLSQLSTKIIFSQKVFTEKGESRLRALSKSFPRSRMDLMEKLKTMPPGTAVLSTLDASGNQTEPAEVRVFAPATTMEVVPDDVLRKATDQGLIKKYSAKAQPAAGTKKQSPTAPAAPVPSASPKPSTISSSRAPPKKSSAAPAPRPLVAGVRRPETEAPGDMGAGNASREPASERKVVIEKKVVVEKKAAGKKGPGILDSLLGGLLKLLDFILKAGGKLAAALLIRPAAAIFRYLTKKPLRLIYLLCLLLLIYIIAVNWALVQGFLDALKIR